MKQPVRLHLAALAAGLLTTLAAYAAPAPADTVVGQARFTHRMSAGMCDRLAQEGQKTDLTKLTAAESEELFKSLMLKTMGDNFTEFSALMEKSGSLSPDELGRNIGEQAVLELIARCPSAGPLVAKMGGARLGKSVEITAAERPTLLVVAQATCKQLDAENAKQPFDKLTAAQRNTLLQQTLVAAFVNNTNELTAQYGEDVMADKAQGEEIGKKIALLMLEICPGYIMEVGRDEIARRRQATATPAPALAPTARPKVPAARKAPLKKTPAKVK
jgi:hypothetical protein